MMTNLVAWILVFLLLAPLNARAADPAFVNFLQSLWPDAQKLGVSRPTFDAATRGLEPDLTLPDLALPGRADTAPKQPEFVQTPADYVRESSIDRKSTRLNSSHLPTSRMPSSA